MASRRDHLQAYQFATGRAASALVSGDPGSGETPMRRAGLGAMFGVVAAVLLVLAAVIYGLLKPVDNTSWARPGALVVEKETGTRYLYLDGELHPTANYTSALLAVGSDAAVQSVSRSSLADVRRGATVGIPGAPADVAQESSLLTGAWSDCLRPGSAFGEFLDFAPRSARQVSGTTRILVAGPDGKRYVLWRGTKYPIDQRPSLIALGMDTEQPVQATPAWLDALPTGTPVAPAAIPGAGTGNRTVAGSAAPVGRLFRTTVSDVSHFYVLRTDGVAPLTATEAALMAAAPGGEQPRTVSPNDIAAVQASADTSLMHRIPDLMSGTDATADGDTALCLLRSGDAARPRTTVVREKAGAAATGSRPLLPPGHAVLAAQPAKPGAVSAPDPYLITDQGVKYQLIGDAVGALGYSDVPPRVLPLSALDQIPTGPSLSRQQALTTSGTD